jgi:hypothetical protein
MCLTTSLTDANIAKLVPTPAVDIIGAIRYGDRMKGTTGDQLYARSAPVHSEPTCGF